MTSSGGGGEGVLRFTPYAWAKLQYFCHAGDTEIGGFGLSDPDDPLLVVDLQTVRQTVSAASVEFEDDAVAELFEDQVDAGHRPEQFARLWCHTHPGHSPDPSSIDEETFARVFGSCDWAVMFILAKGGRTYARIRFHAGPGGEMEIPVAIDYTAPFAGSDQDAWEREYTAHIHPEPILSGPSRSGGSIVRTSADGLDVEAEFDWELASLSAASDAWELAELNDTFGDPTYEAMDVELLMDEYGVSDPAELRALLQHEPPLLGDEL